MNDENKTENTEAEATVVEQVEVYEKAAEMYRSGDKEGAVKHIKDTLGDQAAEDALKVMEEADKVKEEAESTQEEASEDKEA